MGCFQDVHILMGYLDIWPYVMYLLHGFPLFISLKEYGRDIFCIHTCRWGEGGLYAIRFDFIELDWIVLNSGFGIGLRIRSLCIDLSPRFCTLYPVLCMSELC